MSNEGFDWEAFFNPFHPKYVENRLKALPGILVAAFIIILMWVLIALIFGL